MRRRIYIDPEGDLGDHTEHAYLWHLDDEGPLRVCSTGALYDDGLWARYQAACEEVDRLRREVCDALVNEPFDEFEVELATRARELMCCDDYRTERDGMDALEARAREHAMTRVKPTCTCILRWYPNRCTLHPEKNQ